MVHSRTTVPHLIRCSFLMLPDAKSLRETIAVHSQYPAAQSYAMEEGINGVGVERVV